MAVEVWVSAGNVFKIRKKKFRGREEAERGRKRHGQGKVDSLSKLGVWSGWLFKPRFGIV
jgi:hypothetical protein